MILLKAVLGLWNVMPGANKITALICWMEDSELNVFKLKTCIVYLTSLLSTTH